MNNIALRAPAVPIIAVDPYFSVWARNTNLNHDGLIHWTGAGNYIFGSVEIDGRPYSFLGYERDVFKLKQTALSIDALSTKATFEGAGIRLHVRFMTPLLPDDLDLLSRPVSYMSISYEQIDGKIHNVSASVVVSDQLCLSDSRQKPVQTDDVAFKGIRGLRMGAREQTPLCHRGDLIRIEWGYVYLLARNNDATVTKDIDHYSGNCMRVEVPLVKNREELFMFAYDDIYSINYFGKQLKGYWARNGKTIEDAIVEAANDFEQLCDKCDRFSDQLYAEAHASGGKKYAEILSLSFRQVLAAHKLVADENGEMLYISKECGSCGCAATVDVSYPSIPMFLRYNPELIRAMMRPIYRFAASDMWKYDFAPHDVGFYPIITGQCYGLDPESGELLLERQMPVEESGNMIIMEICATLADKNTHSISEHYGTLAAWAEYLIKYGADPDNQLCTDDFAGHLAHNCNLSVKAIMGIMGMSLISALLNKQEQAEKYEKIAREMAREWLVRADNGDGSYKLAFDLDGSYSIKYNMVWDKLWNTKIFPEDAINSEIQSYFGKFNKYGLPLDSRAEYTKSDWMVWVATLTQSQEDFEKFIDPLWQAYNDSPSRVALSDWYDTVSAIHINFLNRTVQGGLFIKLLYDSGKLHIGKC